MKKKAFMAMMLSALLSFAACGGDTDGNAQNTGDDGSTQSTPVQSTPTPTPNPEVPASYIEAIRDPSFLQGFAIKGNDQATDGVLPKAQLSYGDGNIVWEVGQWGSKFDLSEGEQMILPARASVSDEGKTLGVNRITHELSLELAGQLEYDEMATSRVMWSHLLIEQTFTDFTAYRLNEFEKLEATLDFSVTLADKGAIETQPDNKTLPAQFLQYFYVVNRNPESAGYGSFLWFGLGYLDTRYESLPLSYLQDHAGGNAGNYIYCVAAEDTLGKGAFTIGKQYNVQIDLLPHIELALKNAQEHGFMYNTQLSDCVITGMNLGWEVVGAWNVAAKVKNLSLKGFLKE
ncbi:MAG: hypothetical protein E7380_03815 [Clostridiales bacterium]|nr:hypothetical protein [Clostridiales bacterium]MBQ2769511.1 hypothetical protein [Clostridia bacterium]